MANFRMNFRGRRTCIPTVTCALLLAVSGVGHARVTRIVVDQTVPMAAVAGQAPYEQVSGRAFGELDPRDPVNAIIQDINLGKDPDGKVRYEATFVLTKPINMNAASGLMWHDVPNRGTPLAINAIERGFGDVGLASAWQGDNAGGPNIGTLIRPGGMNVSDRHWLKLPIAKNPNGSTITGKVLGRIVNRSGVDSQPLIVQSSPLPYLPATLDTTQARLVTRAGESTTGVVTDERAVAAGDWAWARCSASDPFPGTPDPTQICVRGGFNPALLYQVVFTAKDPLVLGVGFAAWRDVGRFFKTAAADDVGMRNPVAKGIRYSIGRGVSQSGNFLRGWLHLGFNQAENGSRVHDGIWPIIAGRRIALNFRWAQPDGVLELYEAGSEGPQWWARYEDHVRHLSAAGILDRCEESDTCPKIMEHFGSAEVWALKLTPEWVGTDAKRDIPIPSNVRRYYIGSTTHGGGIGGFNSSLAPAPVLNCPGNNFGAGVLGANPVPHTETVNALRVHFRNWVMHGVPPPDSVYPRLRPNPEKRDMPPGRNGQRLRTKGNEMRDEDEARVPDLVPANKTAMGFPTLPAFYNLRSTIPESDFIMPVLDYDWGPAFNYTDGSGIPTNFPPPIKQVIPMLVPRVNSDGNEIGGVPVVLTDAPLGTYLGWNVTAGGARPFHQGQVCDYVGGMIPFAKTVDERMSRGDPRPSLVERYGSHAGYVQAVRRAAANAVSMGFLLQPDADALIQTADSSNVLK